MEDVIIPGAKLQAIADTEWYKNTVSTLGMQCEHSHPGKKAIKTKPIPPEIVAIAEEQEGLVLAALFVKKKLESKADKFWATLVSQGIISMDEHWHYNSITKELELYEEK